MFMAISFHEHNNNKMRFDQMLATTLLILLINLTLVSSQSQKELLLELKNNLTYDPSLSTKLTQWHESTHYCSWSGVKCDLNNRVSSLDLSGESISSGINGPSSSLFKLVHLQSLNLAQNTFYSIELPLGFSKLANLRYLNLSNSGFTGRVPPDLPHLNRLVVLDLTSTYTPLTLENPNFETLFRNYTSLAEIYLDGVNISAQGRVWCDAVSSYLPNLRVLSLSNCYLTGPFNSSLLKLQSLSVIRLDGNTLSSPFPDFLADFRSLRVLTLSSCDLFGKVPEKLFQIKSLQTVDLSNNRELEGSLPEFHLNASLQNIQLSYTKFSGNLSDSVRNLKMLSNFDLRSCSFSGPIPNSIKSLTHLVYLDFSQNRFLGSVPSFAFLKNLTVLNLYRNNLTGRISDSLFEGLENLDFLDLSENSLEGGIPLSLFVLPSLDVLNLSNNSFYGSISDSRNSSYSSPLAVLDLSVNNFDGPIPRFLLELQNLTSLSLSSNNFNGSIELTNFQKLINLVSLDLSFNNLSVQVNENVSMSTLFPRLGSLMLASCKIRKFPLLKNQSSLMMLDLSDNQLSGEIPNWIWEVGNGFLRFLNLSHNQFIGLQEPYSMHGLDFLDLHSNLLRGRIPIPPPSAALVDFSSNNFSTSLPADIGNFLRRAFSFSVANNNIVGTIPPSLCNASRFQILDLSNNSLHGKIPSCLLETTLRVLNLRRNDFDGDIPDTFPIGCSLETLDLSFNVLQGKVPKSLTRCTELEVLNLGNNELNDTFPCWLKNLSKLRVLVLRFNMFHGNVSCLGELDRKNWPNLQIINIASNKFNGVLPENLFRHLMALMVDEDGTEPQLDHLNFNFLAVNGIYYQDSVMVTLKGQEFEMEKILTIFTSIDLSNNRFRGIIPQTIGQLDSLYVLNLSRNALTGHIPSSIGNLQRLESLDLSLNGLSGEIPNQLASLTFLSFLNLSYNHLVGRIPQGSQMQTFSESCFVGNEGLCGFPLNRTCSEVGAEEKTEEEQEISDSGIYVSAALGFVVGLGVIFGPLLFCERWRRCYNKHVNRFILLVLHRQGHHQLENEDW